MKSKPNFLKERFIKIPAAKAKYLRGQRRRRKLKSRHRKSRRHEYRLRDTELASCVKIPYLRVSPNPFSIAFLILVIFSSDAWPHTKSWHAAGSPVHFRHYNHHRVWAAHVHPNATSKSEPYLKSDRLINYVNTPNRSSSNNYSTLRNHVESGAMFLQPSQFLKRSGRSSKPYRILSSRDEPPSPPPPPSLPSSSSRSRSAKSSKSSSSLMPLCSHVGDATNEISARAYVADTVFEGKVRSKGTRKDPIGKYGVTFVVQHVYKDQSSGQTVLRPKTPVRLFFIEKSPPSNTTKPTAHCVQRYNYTKRQGDLTKANIKRGRRYIVFVNRMGPHNYTIIGEPVPQSKKNLQAIKDVLCPTCVAAVTSAKTGYLYSGWQFENDPGCSAISAADYGYAEEQEVEE